MSENSKVGGGNRERDLGESGVEGFNVDNRVLVLKPESARQVVNLNIRVGRPDADVVTVRVIDTGTRDVEFQMEEPGNGCLALWMLFDRVRARAESSPARCLSADNKGFGVRGRTNPSRPSLRDETPTR